MIIILLSATYTLAQRFEGGLLGGLSTSQIDGDTQKDYKKLGIYAGVFVQTGFNDVLGGKIELYYIEKGAVKNIDGYEEFNTKLRYVDMPFLLTIKPFDRAELDLGVAVSYLISYKYITYGTVSNGGLENMHNFDFGMIASAMYYFGEHMAFNVRIEYSMVPVKNQPNWFNSNLSFGLIYKVL